MGLYRILTVRYFQDQNVKYAADYSHINTVTIDVPGIDMSGIMTQIDSHPDFVSILPMMIGKITKTWGYGKHASHDPVCLLILLHSIRL